MLGHAKVVGWLFRASPVRSWTERLWRHIERCPVCQARLASREDARRVLFQAGDAGGLDGLWPTVRRAIREGGTVGSGQAALRAAPVRMRTGWRWAAAVAGFAAAAFLTAGLVRYFLAGSTSAGRKTPPEGAFRIHYVRIAGQPAQTCVFQEKNTALVIVWVDKSL